MKIYKNSIILIFLIIGIVFMLFFPIFEYTTYPGNKDLKDANTLVNHYKQKYKNKDITALSVQYTTDGTTWRAVTSSNEKIKERDVFLCSLFNPRLLKINKNFDIDLHSYIVVVSSFTISFLSFSKHPIEIIFAEKIIVCTDSNIGECLYRLPNVRGHFKVLDLNILGIIFSFFKIIVISLVFYKFFKIISEHLAYFFRKNTNSLKK